MPTQVTGGGSGASLSQLQAELTSLYEDLVVRTATAQGGDATSITLDASASAVNDTYNDCIVLIRSGVGAGQARHITDYVGSSKIASISPAWATNPTSASVFAIIPMGTVDVSRWRDGTPDNLVSGRINSSRSGRVVFSSAVQATVVLPAVAADLSLPSVTVPANPIPTGTSIQRALCAIQYRKSVESSSLANALAGAQDIQVRDDTPGAYVDCINLPDNGLDHAADGVEGGAVIVGNLDVKTTIDAADTYEFQWDEAVVDGASITLYDVQMHIIIEYA